MKVGDTVKITKCDVCSKVVGRTVKVTGVTESDVQVNFGKGRPQLNRPTSFGVDDVELVVADEVVDDSE